MSEDYAHAFVVVIISCPIVNMIFSGLWPSVVDCFGAIGPMLPTGRSKNA